MRCLQRFRYVRRRWFGECLRSGSSLCPSSDNACLCLGCLTGSARAFPSIRVQCGSVVGVRGGVLRRCVCAVDMQRVEVRELGMRSVRAHAEHRDGPRPNRLVRR